MWVWIFVFLAFALLLYISFLKREISKLKQKVKEIPNTSSFGSRLFLQFREKTLMDLVDELNQMIDAFEEKNRQAKQMEENVKLSIAGLSHDLRTPLTSINGYVQLLHAATDERKRAHYLKVIEHSVKRLLEMTDQFYDLARMETNQKEIDLSSISLPNLVEEIFLSFYEQLEEKKIDLQFPEQIQDRHIIADKLMLVRVFQNIVQNILRYAKSKAVISYGSEGDYFILSVTNDIKPDSTVAIEKVFMRFYSEISSRTNTEASGLGLYLSNKLVEKMNGKMVAELNDNWFSLKIYLPINRTHT
ncbi:sensor histidine kinase [Bacillus sp. 7884-1]|uniref:sensor histidine kinase n=1 Tax=Bacillus sp. 7884-1 TaxID=2021693 RepID=UPI000BA54FBA|nr:HAMP domain-containing sensor histidine kinase [Bacillus sp. 7884-1]PAE33671.1 two-component sensor histidine kinase [Bacillus sp. 7884-1]